MSIHPDARVEPGASIGDGTRVWRFSLVMGGARIGPNCSIGQNVTVAPTARIGEGCKIQNNVSLYDGVVLEDFVFCGPSCVFTNVTTPRAEVSRREEYAPTLVRRGATIGANATIVCGVELGTYCFVAAGAVVTRDVAPLALVAGIPARRIGWVSHAGEVLGEDLVCPRTGDRYVQDGGSLRRVENRSGIGPDAPAVGVAA
jgi:UDP-2-acetamido-3-amino-2,3-dideoxy-glucuronate N-acetyltransferase